VPAAQRHVAARACRKWDARILAEREAGEQKIAHERLRIQEKIEAVSSRVARVRGGSLQRTRR
jgi:hypothetical protein